MIELFLYSLKWLLICFCLFREICISFKLTSRKLTMQNHHSSSSSSPVTTSPIPGDHRSRKAESGTYRSVVTMAWPRRPSLTMLVLALFTVYVAHTVRTLYHVVHTEPCLSGSRCYVSYLQAKPSLQVCINAIYLLCNERGKLKARCIYLFIYRYKWKNGPLVAVAAGGDACWSTPALDTWGRCDQSGI